MAKAKSKLGRLKFEQTPYEGKYAAIYVRVSEDAEIKDSEGKKIARDVEAAAEFLGANNLAGEVVVVDDGSEDNTAQAARAVEIAPEISIIVEFIGQFNERPVTSTRRAQTQVIAKDGETIVIGGLIQEIKREIKTGVPILSSIPLIGWFFTHNSTSYEKQDLIIFITPRIIKD